VWSAWNDGDFFRGAMCLLGSGCASGWVCVAGTTGTFLGGNHLLGSDWPRWVSHWVMGAVRPVRSEL
jgi:hypothetical protein